MAQVIPIERGLRHPDLCQAITAAGKACRNRARANGFCGVHQPPAAPERIGPFSSDRVRGTLELAKRRLLGDYDVDEFGFDRELTERVLLQLVKPLYEYWWRADWRGLEHVPAEGAALLVGNHSGTIAVDATVMKFGVLDKHPAQRHVRLLAAEMVFRLPFVAPLARKSGNTLACDEDALRLLGEGELVGVFPEGYKGVGKGYRNRYKVQRFGRGGFVELALKARVPIVPVAIVGAEEIYPMIYNAKTLARMGGFPYFPITPFFPLLGPLGLIPLPSKWIIEFGPPIMTDRFDPDAWQDGMLVFELVDQVRDTIQQMLQANLMKRRSVFF
jgi:1-acyl-sn-glycerol-3-phosphate acyltransferase